eukprot:12586402-Prorocentrum_lima.AAC.1
MVAAGDHCRGVGGCADAPRDIGDLAAAVGVSAGAASRRTPGAQVGGQGLHGDDNARGTAKL